MKQRFFILREARFFILHLIDKLSFNSCDLLTYVYKGASVRKTFIFLQTRLYLVYMMGVKKLMSYHSALLR